MRKIPSASIPSRTRDIEKIVDKFVARVNDELRPKDVCITLKQSAREWFARNGFDDKLGARPLERLVRKELSGRLVDEILFGKLVSGGTVSVSAGKNKLSFSINAKTR